jgi:hypothetical protein
VSNSKPSKKPTRSRQWLLLGSFLLGLLFDPEDGGDVCLKNAKLSLNYIALQPTRLYSS